MEAKTFTEGCSYQGGFAGMKASPSATLVLNDEQFSLRRPRAVFSRSVTKLWARWPAVTELRVESAEEGGALLALTTKARGTGEIRLAGTSPEELWEILDGIADLKERFHTEPVEDRPDGSPETDGDDDGGRPADGDAGTEAGEDTPGS
jgi:hypothetical protein